MSFRKVVTQVAFWIMAGVAALLLCLMTVLACQTQRGAPGHEDATVKGSSPQNPVEKGHP